MSKKVTLVVPEAPAPATQAVVDERRIEKKGIRLGVPDLPLLIIPHPLGGLDIDSVKGRAEVATPQLVKLIQEHAR